MNADRNMMETSYGRHCDRAAMASIFIRFAAKIPALEALGADRISRAVPSPSRSD
jgi:hypothetical protein